jgi:alpha-L-fucosidase
MSSSVEAQHDHKEHTDGIEKYYHPEKTIEYLESIDKKFKPYMFASEENMQWWKEAKLGVFVHWAPAVVNEAPLSWGKTGKPHHKKDGEKGRISDKEYCDTYKVFNPTKFSAEEWVNLWKEAGAKYFVFTAKHHYGFCMWDTKTTDFNIMNTPYGKDVMKELADACKKHDLKFMWYYSQPDWTHPLYRNNELPSKEYNEKILYPQLRELMSYEPDGIWFDGLGKHPDTWNSPKMLEIIRTANPKAIVNHRLGPSSMLMGDFDGPERGIGRFQTNRPWETCDVIGGGWGYMGEKQAMSYNDVIKEITKIAGNGGNLLLNTGPRPDGSIIESHAKRYKQIGKYLTKYGNTIYGTVGGPYISGPWGTCTSKENKIWLHLIGNKENGTFTLPQLPSKIKSYKLLNGGDVKIKNNSNGLEISVNTNAIIEPITIVEIEIKDNSKSISPIHTVGDNKYLTATLKASSNKSKKFYFNNLMPGAKSAFSEGIVLKNSWLAAKEDKTPWLDYKWETLVEISQISIQEGKRIGWFSKVEDFEIKALIDKEWKTIHKGTNIGSFFGLTLQKPIKTNNLRIEIKSLSGALDIKEVNIY